MTVALYARTSTSKQDKGLESQVRALKSYCKDNGLKKTKLYADNGISGGKSSRPALDELMQDIENGTITLVLVYSFSRFARSTKFLINSLEKFNDLNVGFVSLTEKIDTTSPTGRALFSIIGAMAQLEKDLVSARVINGLVNARKKGKVLGRPKTVNAALIQNLRAQGMSYRKISELTKHSISTVSRTLAC